MKFVLITHSVNSMSPLLSCLQDKAHTLKIINPKLYNKKCITLIKDTTANVVLIDYMVHCEQEILELLNDLAYEKIIVVLLVSCEELEYVIAKTKNKDSNILLKPIREREVKSLIDKIILKDMIKNKKIQQNSFNDRKKLNLLPISTENKIHFVKYEEIIYLKAEGRYTCFFLIDGSKILVAKNLGSYDNKLGVENIFFRLHKSFLVNIKHISSIITKDGAYCEMINGNYVPISKRKQKQLMSFLEFV